MDPNLERLEDAAGALGPLIDELCVVGGCAAGLLITDTGASPVRPTKDVDLIVEAMHYVAYQDFCAELAKRGFSQDPESGDSICRWRQDDLMIDILPLDESILGFSSRWYRPAFENRRALSLPRGATIHHIDAPHFLATKLTAFESRGDGDFLTSHDLEDLVRVIDGRPEIVSEVGACDGALRTHIAAGIRACKADRHFAEAFPAFFEEGPERARIVDKRLESLCSPA